MIPTEIDELLSRSLDDHRLSRPERQDLARAFEPLADDDRAAACRRAFDLARAALASPDDGAVLGWLEDVVKVALHRPAAPASATAESEAYFSPGEECHRCIERLFDQARRKVDV